MRARVPASSANLGPGFDALAVALSLYVEVSLERADSFSITTSGCGAGKFDDENHLAAVVVSQILGHQRFSLHVHSDIPLSRGLGSSASLALAAAAAAGSDRVLAVATQIDGHPENAAASLMGGLVVSGVDRDGEVVARSLPLDPEWRYVVVIPEEELSTTDARRVLPDQVPFRDAVHNLSALGLLIAGLGDHRTFVNSSMDDALHQPYRMGLLPFARDLLDVLREAGAAGSCWSGAGSTMLGVVHRDAAEEVRSAGEAFLTQRSMDGVARILDADVTGLAVTNG